MCLQKIVDSARCKLHHSKDSTSGSRGIVCYQVVASQPPRQGTKHKIPAPNETIIQRFHCITIPAHKQKCHVKAWQNFNAVPGYQSVPCRISQRPQHQCPSLECECSVNNKIMHELATCSTRTRCHSKWFVGNYFFIQMLFRGLQLHTISDGLFDRQKFQKFQLCIQLYTLNYYRGCEYTSSRQRILLTGQTTHAVPAPNTSFNCRGITHCK